MGIGRQRSSSATLDAFLKWAKAAGYRIGEHPDHGGVHPVHAKGSWHYDGLAADLNWGPPGSPAGEMTKLKRAARVAETFGLGIILAARGTTGSASAHRDHLHVDVGSSSNWGDRYDTPPVGDSKVQRLQRAVHMPWAEADNMWGPATDARLEAVRHASRLKGVKFPHGVRTAQQAVGTKADGAWGTASRKAHDATVAAVQRVLGVDDDGVWGPRTERAYTNLRKDRKR